jgi:hypothetical protein
MTDRSKTITLTDRPPVTIVEAAWPILARASYHDYDAQVTYQANRNWHGHVTVRQHADERTLVYAQCWHTTVIPGESAYNRHAGELLPATPSMTQIIDTIHRVHDTIDHVDDEHRREWRSLAHACIADLPSEVLS